MCGYSMKKCKSIAMVASYNLDYFWIGDICKKRIELLKLDKTTGQFQTADPKKRSIALPNLNDQALVQLLFAVRESYASNFTGALLD